MRNLLFLLIWVAAVFPGVSSAGIMILNATNYNYYAPDWYGDIYDSPTPLSSLELHIEVGAKKKNQYYSTDGEVSLVYENAVQGATFIDYVHAKTYSLVRAADLGATGLIWERLEAELRDPHKGEYYQSGISGSFEMVDQFGVIKLFQFALESYQDPEIADDLGGALLAGINVMPIDSPFYIDGHGFSNTIVTVRTPEPSVFALFFAAFFLLAAVRKRKIQ